MDILEENRIQIVSFFVGIEEYGIDILSVREIIRVIDITPVPMSPDEVLGVINLRGTVIPVIDFRKLFSLENTENTNNTRIIVIEHNDIVIGVRVDCVSEVLTIATDKLEPAPRNLQSEAIDFINTVVVLEDKESLLLIVSVENLFKHNKALLQTLE